MGQCCAAQSGSATGNDGMADADAALSPVEVPGPRSPKSPQTGRKARQHSSNRRRGSSGNNNNNGGGGALNVSFEDSGFAETRSERHGRRRSKPTVAGVDRKSSAPRLALPRHTAGETAHKGSSGGDSGNGGSGGPNPLLPPIMGCSHEGPADRHRRRSSDGGGVARFARGKRGEQQRQQQPEEGVMEPTLAAGRRGAPSARSTESDVAAQLRSARHLRKDQHNPASPIAPANVGCSPTVTASRSLEVSRESSGSELVVVGAGSSGAPCAPQFHFSVNSEGSSSAGEALDLVSNSSHINPSNEQPKPIGGEVAASMYQLPLSLGTAVNSVPFTASDNASGGSSSSGGFSLSELHASAGDACPEVAGAEAGRSLVARAPSSATVNQLRDPSLGAPLPAANSTGPPPVSSKERRQQRRIRNGSSSRASPVPSAAVSAVTHAPLTPPTQHREATRGGSSGSGTGRQSGGEHGILSSSSGSKNKNKNNNSGSSLSLQHATVSPGGSLPDSGPLIDLVGRSNQAAPDERRQQRRQSTRSSSRAATPTSSSASGSREIFDDLHSDTMSGVHREWASTSGTGRGKHHHHHSPTDEELFYQLRWNGVLTHITHGNGGVKPEARRPLLRALFLWIRSFQVLLSAMLRVSKERKQREWRGAAQQQVEQGQGEDCGAQLGDLREFKAAASAFINDALVELLLGHIPHRSIVRMLSGSKRSSTRTQNSVASSDNLRSASISTAPFAGTPKTVVGGSVAAGGGGEIQPSYFAGSQPTSPNTPPPQQSSIGSVRETSDVSKRQRDSPSTQPVSSATPTVASNSTSVSTIASTHARAMHPSSLVDETRFTVNGAAPPESEALLLAEAARLLRHVDPADLGLEPRSADGRMEGSGGESSAAGAAAAGVLRSCLAEIDRAATTRPWPGDGCPPTPPGRASEPPLLPERVLPGLFVGTIGTPETAKVLVDFGVTRVVGTLSDLAFFERESLWGGSLLSGPIMSPIAAHDRSAGPSAEHVYRFDNFRAVPPMVCRLPGSATAIQVGGGSAESGVLAAVDIVVAPRFPQMNSPPPQRAATVTIFCFQPPHLSESAAGASESSSVFAGSPTRRSGSTMPCLSTHMPATYAFIQDAYVRRNAPAILVATTGAPACPAAALLAGYVTHIVQVQLCDAVEKEAQHDSFAAARVGTGGGRAMMGRASGPPRWEAALGHLARCSTVQAQHLQTTAVAFFKGALQLVGAPLPTSIPTAHVPFDERANLVPLALAIVRFAFPPARPSEAQCFSLLKVHAPWVVLTAFERDLAGSSNSSESDPGIF